MKEAVWKVGVIEHACLCEIMVYVNADIKRCSFDHSFCHAGIYFWSSRLGQEQIKKALPYVEEKAIATLNFCRDNSLQNIQSEVAFMF